MSNRFCKGSEGDVRLRSLYALSEPINLKAYLKALSDITLKFKNISIYAILCSDSPWGIFMHHKIVFL